VVPVRNQQVEVSDSVRRNTTVDWTVRESVRRILRKYGYTPDKQDKATQTVMEQAELLADNWAA
jgi:type I restriction enzyme R subunit